MAHRDDSQMDPMSKVAKFAQRNRNVQDSLDIIERALNLYSLENTCISFNGGKDCTAVVHLIHSVARKAGNSNNEPQLTAFYAKLPNHFEEESKFVQETVERYNLKLLQYSNTSLKESLLQLKKCAPHIKAIFIGSRRDDFKPGISMPSFAPTDNDWPQFMRVNPIVNWTYKQVWDFIRELDIPYCDLYNQGYSSIGTKKDTEKNSSLLRSDNDGKSFYLPAWHLTSSHEERLSRSSSLDIVKANKTNYDM